MGNRKGGDYARTGKKRRKGPKPATIATPNENGPKQAYQDTANEHVEHTTTLEQLNNKLSQANEELALQLAKAKDDMAKLLETCSSSSSSSTSSSSSSSSSCSSSALAQPFESVRASANTNDESFISSTTTKADEAEMEDEEDKGGKIEDDSAEAPMYCHGLRLSPDVVNMYNINNPKHQISCSKDKNNGNRVYRSEECDPTIALTKETKSNAVKNRCKKCHNIMNNKKRKLQNVKDHVEELAAPLPLPLAYNAEGLLKYCQQNPAELDKLKNDIAFVRPTIAA